MSNARKFDLPCLNDWSHWKNYTRGVYTVSYRNRQTQHYWLCLPMGKWERQQHLIWRKHSILQDCVYHKTAWLKNVCSYSPSHNEKYSPYEEKSAFCKSSQNRCHLQVGYICVCIHYVCVYIHMDIWQHVWSRDTSTVDTTEILRV